jgi:hypothetical protein
VRRQRDISLELDLYGWAVIRTPRRVLDRA